MEKIKLSLENGKNIFVEKDTSLQQIITDNALNNKYPIMLCKVNGDIKELSYKVTEEGNLATIDISNSIGIDTYKRTLQFILIKAVLDLFPDAKITIEHSLSKGLFGEIHKNSPLTKDDIIVIKNKMMEIIEKDIQINKVSVDKSEAVKIFTDYGMKDKIRLLNHIEKEKVSLYELDGRYDYFYGKMAYSTGMVEIFDLVIYDSGFILKSPTENSPFQIPPFVERKKLSKIYYEAEQWGNILDVGDVGSLNDKVVNGDMINIVRVAEALHEKKIAHIADMVSERKEVKLILIAGPSSSGKTTFARRLGIQLRVNGLMPIPISLDDYFLDREHTPKDENGEYDFESIYALDLELFNSHLKALLQGEAVRLPTFDFKAGCRRWDEKTTSLGENGILIVEGIHGLNEMLTSSIEKDHKFKIYISALTQLNLDNHNRIATTDVRILRRIVRDYLSRGYGGEATLKMWPSIRRGEEKNIFVFQEEADVMFNSTLVYELCVLKKYAIKELIKIDNTSSAYYQAQRLISFLSFFKEVDMDIVPENSILREFVGGSCFYKY